MYRAEDSGGCSSGSKRSKRDNGESSEESFEGSKSADDLELGGNQKVNILENRNPNPMLCDVVLRNLFDFVGARELKVARRVCKKWNLYSTPNFLKKTACKFESHELRSQCHHKCTKESSTCRWEKFSQYILEKPKGSILYKNFVFCLHSIRLKTLEQVLLHCSSSIEDIRLHTTTISSLLEFYNFLKMLPNLKAVALYNIDVPPAANNRHHHNVVHINGGELGNNNQGNNDNHNNDNDEVDQESDEEDEEEDNISDIEEEVEEEDYDDDLEEDEGDLQQQQQDGNNPNNAFLNGNFLDLRRKEKPPAHIPVNFNPHLKSLTLGNWNISSNIFMKWNMILMGFPNLEELNLDNMARVEIEKCLVNIIAIEALDKGKVKIRKLGLAERKEISVYMLSHPYDNYMGIVTKTLEHLPLQVFNFESKASAWAIRKAVENCRLTLKSLSLKRQTTIESSLAHSLADSVFHNKLYPNLTSLEISNILIGNLDDIRINCPKLNSLTVFFHRNHFCRPEQVPRYLLSPSRIPEEYLPFTTLRTDVITSLPNASPNNTVKTLKWISCDDVYCDTIFSNSVIHLQRIFPNLVSLTASFSTCQDFQTVFRHFLQLEELRVQRKSLCRTENEIILGRASHLLNMESNTDSTNNNNIYGDVSYFGMRNLQNLKWLYLDNDNSLLTDCSVVNGFLKLPNLQFLLINNPKKISAKRLLALTESQKFRFQGFIY